MSEREDGTNGNSGKEVEFPINIFSSELSSLEAITKYLKENLNLSYAEIAALLNRDARTIWGTYHRSLKKSIGGLAADYDCIAVPSSLFRDRSLGVLEALTFYLKQKVGLRYCQIADLIHRDDRTIWTAFKRARRKLDAT